MEGEEKVSEQKESGRIKLDYSLNAKERILLVDKIINQKENINKDYLKILSNYIVFAQTKEEKKEHKILTPNRMVTIQKRETSYQGLMEKFENGEDGVQSLIRPPDKDVIMSPRDGITEQDIEDIPELEELRFAIDKVAEEGRQATGKKRYILKKTEIEMRQDQYVIRNDYKKPIKMINPIPPTKINLSIDEDIIMNKNKEPESTSLISLFEPKDISALLRNYDKIKKEIRSFFSTDFYYLMKDLDNLINTVIFKDYPMYYDILKGKITGKTNKQIQEILMQNHNKTYSVEYLSRLWRHKIPKIIAEKTKENYIMWYYTEVERGQWKRCSRCGQIKLAHNRFFSKNNSSGDGYYSICKECRNSKRTN